METWALVPDEKEPRFVAVDTPYPVYRFVRPRPFVPTWLPTWPPPVPVADEIALYAREYEWPAIGWRGIVYSAPGDEACVLDLLHVAEGVVRFFMAMPRV